MSTRCADEVGCAPDHRTVGTAGPAGGPQVIGDQLGPHVVGGGPARIHINSTGTSALHAALEPRLWELFLATCGMPSDDMLLFDEQLNPRPGRDKSATEGIGVPTDIPEHLVVCRSTLRRILHLGLPRSADVRGRG